jgi:hypothetical protein
MVHDIIAVAQRFRVVVVENQVCRRHVGQVGGDVPVGNVDYPIDMFYLRV